MMKPGWFFIFIPLLGVMVGDLVVGVVVVVLVVLMVGEVVYVNWKPARVTLPSVLNL